MLGGLVLDDQAAFEIKTGQELVIPVRRAGDAEDASMLAHPVGIDRPVESGARGLAPDDDAPWPFPHNFGRQWQGPFLGRPAVVEALARRCLEAARNLDRRALQPRKRRTFGSK